MTDCTLPPYALLIDRDDMTGKITVGEIKVGNDDYVYVRTATGPEAWKARHIISRCDSLQQLQKVKDALVHGWIDSGVVLEEAEAKVSVTIAEMQAYIEDVSETKAALLKAFIDQRQEHWRKIVDHLAATPILGVTPEFAS